MKKNSASAIAEHTTRPENPERAAYKSQMLDVVRRHMRPPEPWIFWNEAYIQFWEQYPPEACGDVISDDPGEGDYDDLAFRAFLTGVHGYRLDDWGDLTSAMASAETYRASGLFTEARPRFEAMMANLESWKESAEWQCCGATDFLLFLEERKWLQEPDDEEFWSDQDDEQSVPDEQPVFAATGR